MLNTFLSICSSEGNHFGELATAKGAVLLMVKLVLSIVNVVLGLTLGLGINNEIRWLFKKGTDNGAVELVKLVVMTLFESLMANSVLVPAMVRI